MLPHQTRTDSNSAAAESSFVYDLKALREEEFSAFAATPGSGIAEVALLEVQLDSDNAYHEKTICAADNLFDCGKSLGEAHPVLLGKGKLARAVFDIRFEDSDRPHKLCICPPNQITFESPADAPRILAWLEKCRLRLLRQALQVLCLLALAAGAFGAADGDEDDDPEPALEASKR